MDTSPNVSRSIEFVILQAKIKLKKLGHTEKTVQGVDFLVLARVHQGTHSILVHMIGIDVEFFIVVQKQVYTPGSISDCGPNQCSPTTVVLSVDINAQGFNVLQHQVHSHVISIGTSKHEGSLSIFISRIDFNVPSFGVLDESLDVPQVPIFTSPVKWG